MPLLLELPVVLFHVSSFMIHDVGKLGHSLPVPVCHFSFLSNLAHTFIINQINAYDHSRGVHSTILTGRSNKALIG